MIGKPFIITHPKTYYRGPFRKCIYCNSTEYSALYPNRPLSDEHVIPLSLGGNLILREASCAACEAITSAFEGNIARRILGPIRIHWNLPTRRRKSRPETLPLHLVYSDRNDIKEVPLEEHPPACALTKMNRPRLIASRDEDDAGEKEILVTMPLGIEYNQKLVERAKYKYGAIEAKYEMGIGGRGNWDLLVAKAAYACALFSTFETMENVQWLIGDLIKKRDSDSLKLFVGRSIYGITQIFPEEVCHKYQARYFYRGRHKFLVITVGLFASLDFPLYDVVVARLYNNFPDFPKKDGVCHHEEINVSFVQS